MKRCGDYELLSEIARGAMGVVYRARGPVGEVALKVLLDPDPDPRFWQEARAVGRLNHDGIVAVHKVGRDSRGRDFLVLELVEGGSLAQRIKREGPLPMDEAIDITRQLCAALGHAHERGVIHRDLKPGNVLLTPDGRAKLTDFGLGRIVDQTQQLTQTGDVLGTPAYMPPEQATGNRRAISPQSDVYGLGATLYAMLTGQPPFHGVTLVNLLRQVLEVLPPPPSKLRQEIPPGLDGVVLRCLAKAPGQRYPSTYALGHALEKLRREAPPSPATHSRGPLALAAALVMFGMAAAVGAYALRRPVTPPGAPTHLSPAPTPTPSTVTSGPAFDPQAEVAEALDLHTRTWDFLNRGRDEDAQALLKPLLESQPQTAAGFLIRGVAQLAVEGDAAGARQDFEQALRLDPHLALAHLELGRAQGLRGDTSAAEHFRRALELDDTLAYAWLGLAQIEMTEREFSDARWHLDEALRNDRNSSLALYTHSVLLTAEEHHEQALAAVEEALAIDRTDPNFVFQRGGLLIWFERWREAREVLTPLTRDHPTPKAFHSLAVACQQLGDLPASVAASRAGLALQGGGTERVSLLLQLGHSEALQGNQRQAAEAFRGVLAARPDHLRGHLGLGMALTALGDSEEALPHLDKAIAGGGRSPDSYKQRALARSSLEQWRGAELDLTKAIARGDDSLRWLRGVVRHELEDYVGARADLVIALPMDLLASARSQAETILATVEGHLVDPALRADAVLQGLDLQCGQRYSQGDAAAGQELARRAQDMPAATAEGYVARGVCRVRLGRIDEALLDLQRSIDASPDNPTPYVARALALAHAGELEAARDDLDRAAQLDPESSKIVFERGGLRSRLGDPDGARQDFERAMRLAPNRLQREQAKAELANLERRRAGRGR